MFVAESVSCHEHLSSDKVNHVYFCGDLHGQYDALILRLDELNFDFDSDFLICVGDLIDRGDQNIEVLDLLREKWFRSVLGNHECMFLAATLEDDNYWRTMHLRNGGQWAKDFDLVTLRSYAQLILKKCPVSFTISHAVGTIGICHTDPLFGNWNVMQQMDPREYSVRSECFWSRKRYNSIAAGHLLDDIIGIDFVVCGHVSCSNPIRAGNQIFIDTLVTSGRITVATIDELLELSN